MADFPSFRQQAEAKSPWQLEDDARHGFSQSVNNNQPQMALYYAQELFKEYDNVLAELRAQVASLQAPKVAAVSKTKKDDSAE